MAAKKMKEVSEVEKDSVEYESLLISEKDKRFDRFLGGKGAGIVKRLFLEMDMSRPLGEEKKPGELKEAYNDWVKKVDDDWVLEGAYNKKMTIENTKKRVISLQLRIKELESDTQIDSETKQKKIARCYAIIKNCQSTLNREVANMQHRR